MYKSKIRTFAIIAAMLTLAVGCGDKNPTSDAHDDQFDVTYTYTPSPATVGTAITFTFEVESDGEHVEDLTGTACELEMEGMDPTEIDLTEAEAGHYSGSHTFTMAGEYEVQFHYMHDGEENHVAMTATITVVD